MRFDNVWRLSTAQALAVASVGGAAASSSAFGTQTYAIQLAYPGSTSSTGGCRIAIVSPNDNAVSSTGLPTIAAVVGSLRWITVMLRAKMDRGD
jgi:ABC-type cobalamin transport system permease subunit